MWATVFAALSNALFNYLIMPLLSKLLVGIQKYYSDKAEESERKAAIDAAVKRYEEAVDVDAQKAAFRDIVRARKL